MKNTKKTPNKLTIALFTIITGKYKALARITLPYFKLYAKQIGAELIISNNDNINQPKLNKFLLYNYLNKYNRIIYLDCTILISPYCPNLFKIVPLNSLGVVFENKNPTFLKYHRHIKKQAFEYYKVKYSNDKMFNAGMMVLSSIHRELYASPRKPIKLFDTFFSETYENAMVEKLKYSLYILEKEFNYVGSLIKENEKNHILLNPEEIFMLHVTGGYSTTTKDKYNLLIKYRDYWYD